MSVNKACLARLGSTKLSPANRPSLVTSTFQRLGPAVATDVHIKAAADSRSFSPAVETALQVAEVLPDLIGPVQPKKEGESLSPLAPFQGSDAYSVIAAGLMVQDKKVSPEDLSAFGGAVADSLEQIEQLRTTGVISADLSDFVDQSFQHDLVGSVPAMIHLNQIAELARRDHYIVPAVNANNVEMVQAFVAAAAVMRAPIIIEWSPGAFKYLGGAVMARIITTMEANKAIAIGLPIPVCCHLDHGTEPAVKEALKAGFNSVMFDATQGGKVQISLADNISKTRELVTLAHNYGATFEGEIGGAGGSFQDVSTMDPRDRQKFLTQPEDAVRFVEKTGVDLLAVSVGPSHGGLKYKGEPFVDLELLHRIRTALDDQSLKHVGLVFHGGSDASPFYPMIPSLTGKKFIKTPSGVPIHFQQESAPFGVVKLNLDTIFRIAMALAHILMRPVMDAYLAEKCTDDFREHVGIPWRVLVMVEAMRKLFELGTAGHAGDYLADMNLRPFGTSQDSKAGADIE